MVGREATDALGDHHPRGDRRPALRPQPRHHAPDVQLTRQLSHRPAPPDEPRYPKPEEKRAEEKKLGQQPEPQGVADWRFQPHDDPKINQPQQRPYGKHDPDKDETRHQGRQCDPAQGQGRGDQKRAMKRASEVGSAKPRFIASEPSHAAAKAEKPTMTMSLVMGRTRPA